MRSKILRILCAGFLSILLLCYGCTPEKAKALQTAVVQFKVEALKAIDMIDALRENELAPPPEPQTKMVSDFVSGVKNTKKVLTPKIISTLVAPFQISDEKRKETDWDKKRINLRQQYIEFASIFDRLQAGSYLAGDAVEKSKDLARDLTLQMAVFAKVIKDNPPIFIQYRSKFLADLTKIKEDKSLKDEKMDQAIAPFFERWQNLMRDEQKKGDETVAQCLKAALIGKRVCELIRTYKEVSIDDLNTIISLTLDTAGSITGKDTTKLNQQVNDTISAIKADEIWQGAVEGLLNQLNKAAASRSNVS